MLTDHDEQALLHVFCPGPKFSGSPFFTSTVILGAPAMDKLNLRVKSKMSPDHAKCPHACCLPPERPKGMACSHCGAVARGLQRCPCGDVFYCDQQCQRADWKVHKTECKASKRDAVDMSSPDVIQVVIPAMKDTKPTMKRSGNIVQELDRGAMRVRPWRVNESRKP